MSITSRRSSKNNVRYATHAKVPPIIDENCTVLILGSMLSPKSEQARFYYAHPQNRFWRVISAVLDRECPIDDRAKAELILANGIALWDVIDSCDIVGAEDSTITNVKYNDISSLLIRYPKISKIFTTGGKAHELLTRYNKNIGDPIISCATRLPSTSPQNCRIALDQLISAYSVVLDTNKKGV